MNERFLKVVHSWVIPKVSTENSNQSLNCYREQEMGLNMRVQLCLAFCMLIFKILEDFTRVVIQQVSGHLMFFSKFSVTGS